MDFPGISPHRFLDARGCALRYSFSLRHWHRLVERGLAPPPQRFGRLVRWSLMDLESWEAAQCPASIKTENEATQHQGL
jgi:predicted DNA-binding transcriptional regulator AlpA